MIGDDELAGLLLAACGDSVSGPVMGQDYQVTFRNLNAIPTEQGTLVVWVVAALRRRARKQAFLAAMGS